MMKRILATMLAIAFSFLLTGTALGEVLTIGGLTVTLSTDKASYGADEDIEATVRIQNDAAMPLEKIRLKHQPLQGYELVSPAGNIHSIDRLGTGESISFTVVHSPLLNQEPPKTGDDMPVGWLLAGMAAAGIMLVFLVRGNRKAQRIFSVLLCIALIGNAVPYSQAKAENADGVDFSVSEQVTVEGKETELMAALTITDSIKEDTDGDGIPDYSEGLMGTDIYQADSDGDGLTDYQEITELETDPLQADMDHDGISDYHEDNDRDGLSNGWEYAAGLCPVVADTDFDDLKDGEEGRYGTDPLKWDTDGDGASDGMEVYYGTDPLIPNASFEDTAKTQPVDEMNPVSLEVRAKVKGNVLGTVSVNPASSFSHPLMSGNVAGALGTGFDIQAGGSIESAELIFRYDTSLGRLGADFQPRVYYLNEETQSFELLPDQTVTEGEVRVRTTHFSCYILLNKIEFDEAWETEIRPPDAENDPRTGLDVVFVIDSSGSMSSNDRSALRKVAAREFVKKLGENDRGAVIDFDSYATVYSEFTQDHEALNTAINRCNASGGTNLSVGMQAAIMLFTNNYSRQDAYKYIVFLTDGNGTYHSSYTTQAAENDIVVYTIGLGSGVKESVLKAIAEGTGGKYYFASTANDLVGIYDEVSIETVDYNKDSNKDGISDYYSKMICDGNLLLSNGSYQFIGFDFTYKDDVLCADWDGDGLKNGEELIVTQNGNRVSVRMVSDPTLYDTDMDGYNDYQESVKGTNPLYYNYGKESVNYLLTNKNFENWWLANEHDTNFFFGYGAAIVDTMTLNLNQTKDAKQLMMDYFYDYSSATVSALTEDMETQIAMENATGVLENINSVAKGIRSGKKFVVDNVANHLQGLHVLRSQIATIRNRISIAGKLNNQSVRLEKLAADLLKASEELNTKYKVTSKLSIKLSDFGNKYSHFMNKKNFTGLKNSTTISVVFTVIGTAADISSTMNSYAKLKANTAAYLDNLDVLTYLGQSGNRISSRNAAKQICEVFEGQFEDFNKQRNSAIGDDIATNFGKLKVAMLVKSNPYVAAVKYTFDLLDLLIGMSHKADKTHNALTYESMTTAMRSLILGQLVERKDTYECIFEDNEMAHRYLTHMAQLRIAGERNYVSYSKNTGLVSQFFTKKYDAAKTKCLGIINHVWNCANTLNLELSSKLQGLGDV